jgi:hypothetical protein
MKNTLNQIAFSFRKINKTHLQFVLMLLALILLVLGAGAPEIIGGIGG